MKKLLIFFAIVTAAAGFVPWALSPSLGHGVNGRAIDAANRVRQLLLASHVFYMDQMKEALPPRYPRAFSELVPKYLSQKDLEKLTANLQIKYFRPTGSPEEGQVIVVAHIRDFVIYGAAPYDVPWQKLE